MRREIKNAADPSFAGKGGSAAGDPPLKGNAGRPSARGRSRRLYEEACSRSDRYVAQIAERLSA